jgi:hypothetical protein
MKTEKDYRQEGQFRSTLVMSSYQLKRVLVKDGVLGLRGAFAAMGGYTGLAMTPRFERPGQVLLAIQAHQFLGQWSKFEEILNSVLAREPIDQALGHDDLVARATDLARMLMDYSKFARL